LSKFYGTRNSIVLCLQEPAVTSCPEQLTVYTQVSRTLLIKK